ncbi:MAG: TolC family outer membrane protein, partial [Pseudomonadota bacterium]|nr:TolC family outer membrane protein [Pseudomonadota bacterium]
GRADVESESTFFTSEETRTPSSIALNITQPLYRGGRTVAQTRRAENLVLADRERLIDAEQNVLLDVTTAYMDVLRDRAVLKLAMNNEQRLRRQLEAAQDRFDVGEVTRTDVAQAEARVANAVAERVVAEAELTAARAAYLNVVGSLPQELASPPPLAGLPATEQQAREIAIELNPTIRRAVYIARAARADIAVQFGVLLPRFELTAEMSRIEDATSRGSLTTRNQISAQLTVPLYQSGSEHAQVRATREVASQRRIEIEEARRSVLETTTLWWETLVTARAQIAAFREAVRAAEIALDGVEQEAAVGSRTTLDVLDAEQELFLVRVDLVRAEHDDVVASYTIEAVIGRLTASRLGLPVQAYDPTVHYLDVRDKVWGTGGEN